LSRAFVKEEDEEHLNKMFDVKRIEEKTEWLKIQEKKLDTLLNDPKSKAVKAETLNRWIRETKADIEKTKKELAKLEKEQGKKA
jgi:hypothetical protein